MTAEISRKTQNWQQNRTLLFKACPWLMGIRASPLSRNYNRYCNFFAAVGADFAKISKWVTESNSSRRDASIDGSESLSTTKIKKIRNYYFFAVFRGCERGFHENLKIGNGFVLSSSRRVDWWVLEPRYDKKSLFWFPRGAWISSCPKIFVFRRYLAEYWSYEVLVFSKLLRISRRIDLRGSEPLYDENSLWCVN